MSKKSEYSKKDKVKACEDYEKGLGSFRDIAKRIGAGKSVVHRWYLLYKEHGPSGFDTIKSEYSK